MDEQTPNKEKDLSERKNVKKVSGEMTAEEENKKFILEFWICKENTPRLFFSKRNMTPFIRIKGG